LNYRLLSLSNLARLLKVQVTREVVLRELSSNCAEKFVQVFDEITNAYREVHDYHSLVQTNRDYVSPEVVRAAGDAVRRVRSLETKLQTRYAQTLSDVRSARADENSLWKILDQTICNGISPCQLEKSDFRSLNQKIHFITKMEQKGARYIGFNGKSFDFELGATPNTDIFVFKFSDAARRRSREWVENIAMLHQLLLEKSPSSEIILLDCDAFSPTLDYPKIMVYRNAMIMSEDVLEERKLTASKPAVRYNSAYLDRSEAPKPHSRILVSLPCPGASCSSRIKYDWICSKCGCQVEYGHIDSNIYCECGRCDYKHWHFRCPSPNHGLEFSEYGNPKLLSLLKELEPFEECNILILGRTGVGKSTWINALANYLTYPTLDDALEAESLSWIIPFAFNMYNTNEDGGYEPIKVQVGFNDNSGDKTATRKFCIDEHDGSLGQSATKRTIVHRVQIGHCQIRLIDTPGIGDTRGASQDRKNMADILNVLQAYPKLHGIMILLKPNEQRLDLMFKFCIQELLAHLHRDAAKNIAFGFTNTRGTNYQPGDSFDPLSQLLRRFTDIDISLRKHNVYCFDSESFRYLAAYKQQNQTLGHLEENRRSWEYSVGEAKRLLNHFKDLKPHLVTSTVNLFQTRVRIVKMTQPMALIAQAIKSSISVNEDEMKRLDDNMENRKELEKDLKVKVSTVSALPLDQPRTTCQHIDCITQTGTGSWGQDGKQLLKTIYKSQCHSPCRLSGIPVENVGNAGLRSCWAMSGGICKICKHNWSTHLHIDFEQIEETCEVDDPKIVALLNNNASFTEKKQAAIAAKKKHIEELEQELQEFTSAAAQFSNFLKRNAIMPYNDATMDYIARTIEEERGKVAAGGSRDKLERLTQYQKQYAQEIEALDEQMGKGETSKPLEQPDIERLVEKLHALPKYGQMLKGMGLVFEELKLYEQREKSYVMRARSHFMGEKDQLQNASLFKKSCSEVTKKIGQGSGNMTETVKRAFIGSWKG
jgi:hypothetical protein